jgi:hypothetical protein
MNGDQIQIEPTSQYPDTRTPTHYLEFVCKCGVRCRVDIEGGARIGAETYHHCNEDEYHSIPGSIIATWEERGGAWAIVG